MASCFLRDDLRKDWVMLKALEKALADGGAEKAEINKATRYYKEKIRDKRVCFVDPLEDKTYTENWKTGKREDDWDSRHRFFELPYVVEDIDEFKEWNWQRVCYYDGRDCTGQWFTQFMVVFPMPRQGKTLVYEEQGLDV